MNPKSDMSSFQYDAEKIISFIKENPDHPLLILLNQFLNSLLLHERRIFLKHSKHPNKANGFYNRSINTTMGTLNLNVPRDRASTFNSIFLPPPYHRTYPQQYHNLILSLITNSYSPNSIKSILQNLNLPFSYDHISEIKDSLLKSAQELNSFPIPDNLFAVFIDAYHGSNCGLIKDSITGKIIRATIYIVIGITTDGSKNLLAFFIESGTENKSMWLSIFNKLRERGLTKALLFISDDFSGLKEAIKEIFPLSDHQICLIHLQRNIRRNMRKDEANEVISEINKLKYERDFAIAVSRFEQILLKYQNNYPSFIKSLISKKEHYFTFIKYPKEVWKHIYTTNIVENFNSRIEVERIEKGGYFATEETAECIIYLIYQRLKNGKWSKPIPRIKGAEYELNQMFNLKFSNQTHTC